MKYCQKCGNQISDDAQFCPACGQSQQMQPAAKPIPRVQRSGGKKLHCPNCGSTSLSAIVESDVTGGTSYNQSLTKKSSVSTMKFSNVHRNYWMCGDCGQKFRNLQNLEAEIAATEKRIRTMRIGALVIFVPLIFLLILGSILNGSLPPIFLLVLLALIAALLCYSINYYKKQVIEMIKEKRYLERNCFD